MKLIILDRDGVINQDSDQYIKSPEEWVALQGSLEAMARLSRANWQIVIASNQSGLARGLFNMHTLNAIHLKMKHQLAQLGGHLNAFFICPHGPDDQCSCRKPSPGLFYNIRDRYKKNLKNIPAIGDSLRDLQACASAGCSPWLVMTGNGAKTFAANRLPTGTQVRANLAAVVDDLLLED